MDTLPGHGANSNPRLEPRAQPETKHVPLQTSDLSTAEDEDTTEDTDSSSATFHIVI